MENEITDLQQRLDFGKRRRLMLAGVGVGEFIKLLLPVTLLFYLYSGNEMWIGLCVCVCLMGLRLQASLGELR